MVDATGRTDIPLLKIPPAQSHTRARHPTRVGAKITVVLIPDIAHGRMDIGDMQSAIGQYSLRNTMTAGKDEIVATQRKAFNGSWEQRQIVAIGSARARQSIDKRRDRKGTRLH